MDLTELTLIKTLLENPGFMGFALEYLDIKSFQTHFAEFALVLEEKWDDPLLLGNCFLSLRDFIKSMKIFAIFRINPKSA